MTAVARSILAFASLLAISSPVLGNTCDVLVGQLLAGVPELKRISTIHMAGAPDFDLVNLRHPQASAVALSCGSQQPSLSIDWRGGPPSSEYFELVGLLGGIVTGVPAATVRLGAVECEKRAKQSTYEMSGYQLAGVRYQCAIFTHEGGGFTISVHG